MSFTNYKWGVSKSFRSLWPITAFSALRTDYARMLQINHFILNIVSYTFKRLNSFKNWFSFSHTVLKSFLIPKFDSPLLLVEVFFYFRNSRVLVKPYLTKLEKARIKENKRLRKFEKKKKSIFKYFKRKYYSQKSFFQPEKLNKQRMVRRLFLLRQYFEYLLVKYRRARPKKYRPRPMIYSVFQFSINRNKANNLRYVKRRKLKKRKLPWRRYSRDLRNRDFKYFRLMPSIPVNSIGLNPTVANISRQVKLFSNNRRYVYVLFLRKFLELFSFDINVNIFFAARMVTLGSCNINIYMSEFTRNFFKRRETSPKPILKQFLKYLKRNRKLFRISGAKIIAKGRFNRKARVKPVKVFFGRVPLTTKRARIDYMRRDFRLRFGIASLNLYVKYAR